MIILKDLIFADVVDRVGNVITNGMWVCKVAGLT